jgi:hypothetical protein
MLITWFTFCEDSSYVLLLKNSLSTYCLKVLTIFKFEHPRCELFSFHILSYERCKLIASQ